MIFSFWQRAVKPTMQTLQAPQTPEEKEIGWHFSKSTLSKVTAPKWMQPAQFLVIKPHFLFELYILQSRHSRLSFPRSSWSTQLSFLGNSWQARSDTSIIVRKFFLIKNWNLFSCDEYLTLYLMLTLGTPWGESLLLPVAPWWQLGTIFQPL